MKERLVEDWLTRINERGYQTAFGQTLLSRGFRVLRISHGPYEHGKDVLAISPENEVHCYQLKDGDIDIKQWEHDYGQICALVETRPNHPALPSDYIYRPFIVTNGIFTDPALDRIKGHNTEWERRGCPKLTPLKPWGYLEWHCDDGAERDQMFAQPQSWKELVEFAAKPAIERLPEVLRSDFQFSPMFLLAYSHRINWSIIGNIDQFLSSKKI